MNLNDPNTQMFVGWCLAGLGVMIFLITLIVTIGIVNTNNSHRDGQVMQQCIATGGSWVYGSCIVGRSK